MIIFLIYVSAYSAQVNLFSENIGTTGATGNPGITSFSSFQNSGCNYLYSGTGDVRNSTASSGYTGASGSNNVYLANSASKTFIISGINTLGYTGLSLSYGLYNSSFLSTGGGLTVETSTNGTTYTALTRSFNLWILPGWMSENATGTIPNTSNLYIRFTNTSASIDFRIDDVVLKGTPNATTNPSPYTGWPAAFTFNNWPASSAAGTFPANMVFHYGSVNNIDPTLTQITASQDYNLAYNLICGSKITGQGANGFSFKNASPGNASTAAGNLGEAVVAINTLCRSNIKVSWTAGTISSNGIIYKLRAQYRTSATGTYTDLPNTGLSQIEYTSPGTATNFGPITLPTSCENKAVVQIRWAYYYGGTGAGNRDEIYLTNVSISSDPVIAYSVTGGGSYCAGGAGVAIGLSSSQSGVNYQLYNGAASIGAAIAGTGSILSFGTFTSAGTYTVKATNVVSSCTAAMSGNAVITINSLPSVTSVSSQSVCGGKATTVITFSSSLPGAAFSWTNSNTAIGLAASGTGNIASYTSPVISTPPNAVGTISVAATLSGCAGTTTTFSITIKGPQPASVWNGSVSTDWFDSDNWSNCVCGSVTSATIPAISGPNFYPLIGGITAANVNTITVNSSASLSIQSTQTLNVYGNWINNGYFIAQQGLVSLNGGATQILSGSATTAFYDLTLNNPAGASLSSAEEIQGSLQLNAGSFNTNNQLTLLSNAGGAGKIGPINSAADIINQVTVQQYAPGGATGWALLGSPLNSALTMADWNDNFAISCASCPDGSTIYSVPFTSIYSYNETIAGTYSATAKYIPITTISNAISNGVGYWTYLGNGYPNTSAITFDVKGTVAKSSCLSCSGAVTIPVSRTVNNGLLDDGWNLIANPLPSPISWTALRNGNANVDNAIYVFNADLNGGLGAHTTYINNVSSDVSGGITDVIPMCQGFYIHATAPTLLTAGENIKINANPTFLKVAATTTVKPIVRLVLSGPNNSKDMATFYFEQGGTPNFQTDFDAYKLIYDATQPYIASMSDSILTYINGLPALNSNLSIPVKAFTAASDSFNISLLKSDFPDNICITLFDAFTGITTNILTNDYSCILYDTTSAARFTLNFFTTPLVANSNVVQPSCLTPAGGFITAAANNSGPWNYEWRDNTNNIVKTNLNKSTPDSLTTLSGGNYTVKINTVGQCDNYSHSFSITEISLPTSNFTANSFTTSLSNGGQISFVDQSLNAQTYFWNFDDGYATSSLSSPFYNYSLAGIYNVKLITTSASLCTDSITHSVMVVDDITGVKGIKPAENSMLLLHDNSDYFIQFNFKTATDADITLFDPNGKLIRADKLQQTLSKKFAVDLRGLTDGVYLLKVTPQTTKQVTFKIIK